MDTLKLLQQIEKNTRTKPQLTLEYKMNMDRKRFPFDEPIFLDDGNYMLGLISLEVYNSIFNITTSNNIMRYSKDDGVTWIDLIIPPGAYEIDQINDEIHRQLELNDDVFNDIQADGYPIELAANIATQKSVIELKTSPPINTRFHLDLNQPNSIASLLGFTNQILTNEFNFSENKVNIINIDKIHLCCDAIRGSILNGLSSNILFSFSLDVSSGYKIIQKPRTILYKEIDRPKLENIEFYFIDDDGNNVNFQGETITFTLQLIKI